MTDKYPQLFPEEIIDGYILHDILPASAKLPNIRFRRIKLKAVNDADKQPSMQTSNNRSGIFSKLLTDKISSARWWIFNVGQGPIYPVQLWMQFIGYHTIFPPGSVPYSLISSTAMIRSTSKEKSPSCLSVTIRPKERIEEGSIGPALSTINPRYKGTISENGK